MKLGVCVPYRNRELHLNEFIPKVGKYLKEQGIDFQMYFCHQTDDKLFNRGATKNIAAKHAIEEGCDYIVFHDIDMIPEEGCDYSYPDNFPIHLATQISQMGYKLKYHEYFGGAVLFTKEQLEATNGYSNNYWDWGMEDDDLFWRCHKEGLTNDTYLTKAPLLQTYAKFNGNSSSIEIPFSAATRGLTTRSHTISVLCRVYQQPDKKKIFLIGDRENEYVEYPIFRLPGYDYGLSFNNSRALSFTFWNTFNHHNYMWLKRYDGQWSWVTVVVDYENKLSHFYLNGNEVDSKAGHGSPSPLSFNGRLKPYGTKSIYLGTTPTQPDDSPVKFLKGDIAKVFAWNRVLDPEEIENLHEHIPEDDIVIDLDFNDPNTEFIANDIELIKEEIQIPNSIIPHRKEGRMRCLPHKDEGLVNGKWAKGETTAKNEERYVLQMQQDKINYKEDGIKQVQYEFISEEKFTPWAKMINIKL
jgi:hypothetical protein